MWVSSSFLCSQFPSSSWVKDGAGRGEIGPPTCSSVIINKAREKWARIFDDEFWVVVVRLAKNGAKWVWVWPQKVLFSSVQAGFWTNKKRWKVRLFSNLLSFVFWDRWSKTSDPPQKLTRLAHPSFRFRGAKRFKSMKLSWNHFKAKIANFSFGNVLVELGGC